MQKQEKRSEQDQDRKESQSNLRPIVSAVLPAEHLAEIVYDKDKTTTAICYWDGQKARVVPSVQDGPAKLVPLQSASVLARIGVTRLASKTAEYGETADLLTALRSYLYRYVDLPSDFERLAALYVLLTWVYDRFEELPYLRRRGDFGTGKTRFLLTLGSVCYKPVFAGGASTVSPLFHLIDKIGGTLIIDEADFRFSDENAQIAKILNNGNVRGFPVLRSESVNGKDFRPRAFKVFGPKIVAMRGRYDDPALESRFITETASAKPPRSSIPINLPKQQEADAQTLRNRLLLWRFRNHGQITVRDDCRLKDFEPRLRQILLPLFSLAADEADKVAILNYAQSLESQLREARGQSLEAEIMACLLCLMEDDNKAGAGVQAVATLHGKAFLPENSRALTARAMGHILRTRLNLPTRKSHGVFIVPREAGAAVAALAQRYGVTAEDADRLRVQAGLESRVEVGDDGDNRTAA